MTEILIIAQAIAWTLAAIVLMVTMRSVAKSTKRGTMLLEENVSKENSTNAQFETIQRQMQEMVADMDDIKESINGTDHWISDIRDEVIEIHRKFQDSIAEPGAMLDVIDSIKNDLDEISKKLNRPAGEPIRKRGRPPRKAIEFKNP